MLKNAKFLVTILAIAFLMGTFSVAQGKGVPADVEKWLKKNKIGPFTEDTVDYDAYSRPRSTANSHQVGELFSYCRHAHNRRASVL